jgi:hypothetical protein
MERGIEELTRLLAKEEERLEGMRRVIAKARRAMAEAMVREGMYGE